MAETAARTYPWFALRVRSNHERITRAHLHDRGYEEFAPSYKVERHWWDRIKQIDQFLFPGYIFCQFNPNDRLPILTAPGVVDIVGFGKFPDMFRMPRLSGSAEWLTWGLLITPYPYLQVGQTVLIERGPLSGVEGILAGVKGKLRLVVSINLLQRSVSAEVDRHSIRSIDTLSTELVRRKW